MGTGEGVSRRVMVLGAGGIIGQYMMAARPQANILYVRHSVHPVYDACFDITDTDRLVGYLDVQHPDLIVNLAGENRVDVVEADPESAARINVAVPYVLADWCRENRGHLIQVSTQGVFSGEEAPYSASATPNALTFYGKQKVLAEEAAADWTVARVTFVLGTVLMQPCRRNPLEDMLSLKEQKQVNDRWFSPSFAPDVAHQLWKLVQSTQKGVFHLGIPERVTRYDLAKMVNPEAQITPVSHNDFPGLAPRPRDTTWADDALYSMTLQEMVKRIRWTEKP